jgi:hypothetical protein
MLLAGPLTSNAQATQDGALPVGDDQLSVIPGEIGDDIEELGPVKGANVHAGGSKVSPITARGGEGAEPVV